MLDQLDQVQVSTPASSFSSLCPPSYTIGPVDSMQITTLHAHLSNGEECALLVPVHLLPSILTDALFKEGYEWGYLEGELDEDWSVPRIVNWTYYSLSNELWDQEAWETLGPHVPTWIVGWLLGSLARLAETERMLALVGLAHLCFLLPFLSLDAPSWPPYGLYHAHFPHAEVLRAYRRRVRGYREQGKSFAEAQRLALTT